MEVDAFLYSPPVAAHAMLKGMSLGAGTRSFRGGGSKGGHQFGTPHDEGFGAGGGRPPPHDEGFGAGGGGSNFFSSSFIFIFCCLMF